MRRAQAHCQTSRAVGDVAACRRRSLPAIVLFSALSEVVGHPARALALATEARLSPCTVFFRPLLRAPATGLSSILAETKKADSSPRHAPLGLIASPKYHPDGSTLLTVPDAERESKRAQSRREGSEGSALLRSARRPWLSVLKGSVHRAGTPQGSPPAEPQSRTLLVIVLDETGVAVSSASLILTQGQIVFRGESN